MKRKKWSELEEQTLLSKYSDLLNSGTLSKLKTREKKFKPIADHVNSVHHLQDPITFPFKWSWRDVSIKVQNMRYQYLGVKQKIRISKDEFNWKDGENHWENFLKCKEVFGDVELEVKGKKGSESNGNESDLFEDCCDLGFAIDSEEEEEDDGVVGDGDDGGDDKVGPEGEFGGEREFGDIGVSHVRKSRKGVGGSKGFGLLGTQVLELREGVVRREEKRKEREFVREKGEMEREQKRRESEFGKEKLWSEREERMEEWEMELEDRELFRGWKEGERRLRLEKELDEESRRRMEEKLEEEAMEWKERLLGLQIEHEKAMMQMHMEACQNQMQILGVMARLFCQFYGLANDGLTAGLGGLPPEVLQNLQHPGGLGDNGKPDSSSPSEFM
ncbi:cytochrome P450 77A3-like [Hibiscus syriacus]|uniref:Cytochrome P450 77A3-like n=1 Tax=Hibiscus syriacus TaxID=106335 RepID=A0A6A2YYU2_HIBSY|nr:cytochrome P450 77A3-like [Hibiscus syriacus]